MSLHGAESSPSLTVRPQAAAKLVFPVCEAGGPVSAGGELLGQSLTAGKELTFALVCFDISIISSPQAYTFPDPEHTRQQRIDNKA